MTVVRWLFGLAFTMALIVLFVRVSLWLVVVDAAHGQAPPWDGYPDAAYPSYETQEEWHRQEMERIEDAFDARADCCEYDIEPTYHPWAADDVGTPSSRKSRK